MFSGSFWELLGGSWGALGSSLGPLDRPKRASRFVLELSWASFARFLLPKMAWGASWGCIWRVLGVPEGLVRVVLASVKPISTLKTALPSNGESKSIGTSGVPPLLLPFLLISSLCSCIGPPDRRHRPLGLYNMSLPKYSGRVYFCRAEQN